MGSNATAQASKSPASFITEKSPSGASYTGPSFAERVGMASYSASAPANGMLPPVEQVQTLPMNWRLGFQSRHRSAKQALDDIYQILKGMSAMWLRKGPYNLQCKRAGVEGGRKSCVFGLRLYKESIEPEGFCLVAEFQRLEGDVVDFFDVCNTFQRELAGS